MQESGTIIVLIYVDGNKKAWLFARLRRKKYSGNAYYFGGLAVMAEDQL